MSISHCPNFLKSLLAFIFFTFYISTSFVKVGAVGIDGSYQSGDKYSIKERVGLSGVVPKDLEGFVGWQYNWHYSLYYKQTPSSSVIRPHEFFPMLTRATANLDIVLSEENLRKDGVCSVRLKEINAIIAKNSDTYPSGTKWLLGNEIGWDVIESPELGAKRFAYIKACIELLAKDTKRTFSYGSGALISIWHLLPKPNSEPYCVSNYLPNSTDYERNLNSGYNYFKNYLATLKNVYKTVPDFVAYHDYTCYLEREPNYTALWNDAHNVSISAVRRLMKENGMQDKDLYITEFAPLTSSNPTEILNYLDFSFRYFVSKKDTNLGNPKDNYRMVQKWAWFLGSMSPMDANMFRYGQFSMRNNTTSEIYDQDILNPLGEKYKTLIKQYNVNDPKQADFNKDGLINNSDFQFFLDYFFSRKQDIKLLPYNFDLNYDGLRNLKDVLLFVKQKI